MSDFSFENGLFEYAFVDVRKFAEKEAFERALFSCSKERRIIIEKKGTEKGRLHSLGATIALDICLSGIGLRENEMTYYYNEKGKPYFLNEKGLFFSLSHSGDFAFAVLSCQETGCDLEIIKDRSLKAMRRVFSEKEKMIFDSFSADEGKHFFFRNWTLKESFSKVCGLGMAFPFEKVEFLLSEEGSNLIPVKITEEGIMEKYVKRWSGKNVFFAMEVPAPKGYKASVILCKKD